MDSFTLDFEKLTQETMGLGLFHGDLLDDNLLIEHYPSTAGVIYYLQKGRGTFGIKGFPVLSIQQGMQELLDAEASQWELFKLDASQRQISALDFFSVDSYEAAEMLCETMMNRRFPYQEDMVCNISDPGFSWWGNMAPNRFDIHFLSHQVERSGKLVRLGPIGDRKIAARRFQQFFMLFSQYIQKENYVCTEKTLSYFVTRPSGIFLDLKNLIFNGVFSETLKTLTSLDKSLHYYFAELATARRFWLEIEQKIKPELEQSSLFFS